jgi:DNA-binding MarR family transcriptional regulator
MPEVIDQDEFERLYGLVAELYRLVACPWQGEDDPFAITPSHKRAIGFLRRNPGATLSELAADLDMSLGSTSDLVDRLVIANFIERQINPADRRQVQLSLTDYALARSTAMREQRRHEFQRIKSALTPEQWSGFVQGLEAWTDAMDEANPRKYVSAHTQSGAKHVS